MKFIKTTLLFISILLLNNIQAFSQWEPLEVLYKDAYIKVELQYKLSENSCEGGKQNKFRYNISSTSSLRPNDYFVTWKMDYVDCNGNLYYRENSVNIGKNGVHGTVESMDYMFTCLSIENKFYDVTTGQIEKNGTGLKTYAFSKEPKSITGKSKIFRGEKTELNVNGGVLGVGGEWVWYKNKCGGERIGKGDKVILMPTETTTYFVRAEGKNVTDCVELKVEVDQHSTAPTSINGKVKACKGEEIELSVEGGSLGLDADWVWTIGDCDGKKIGIGSNILIKPENRTTYYVKAEGKLNKTNCAAITIDVFNKSVDAVSIDGATTICEGQSVTLSVNGGKLSEDAKWMWYTSSCGGGFVGNGVNIKLSPSYTTTYYVRGEGICNTTKCIPITVAVNKKSLQPSSILRPLLVYKNEEIELKVAGGSLGQGAKWEWYKGNCGSGKLIGTGHSITIKTKREEEYFVRATGSCNETECLGVLITPKKAHVFHDKYSDGEYDNKFLQLGAGIGIDVNQILAISQELVTPKFGGNATSNDSSSINITGIGLKGDFIFHPFMKDYLSFGLLASYSIGTSTEYLNRGNTDETRTAKYLYTRFDLGSEIAFGLRPVKMLLIYKNSIQSHDFQLTVENSLSKTKNNYNNQFRKEIIGAGFRVGSYSSKYNKRKYCVDIIYNIANTNQWSWSNPSWTNNYNLTKWQAGFGLAFWIQSVLKIQIDFISTNQVGKYLINSPSGKSSYIQGSLVYNFNAFY